MTDICSDSLHKQKLPYFCRICGEAVLKLDVMLMKKKESAEKFVTRYYGHGFEGDNVNEHPSKVCIKCYNKLKWWSENKAKFDKNKKRNEEKGLTYETKCSVPDTLEKGKLACLLSSGCKVCSFEQFIEVKLPDSNSNIEPSPSKYQKLTENPVISPSDALKRKSLSNARTECKARKSILIEKTESAYQQEGEKEQIKIYVSEQVFDINQCEDSDLALLFSCALCSNIPKFPFKVPGCNHIVCLSCIQNYRKMTKSSKCPFQNCKQVYDENQIVSLSGRELAVFNTLRMNCTNNFCKFQSKISLIDEHSKECKKRGTYKNVKLRNQRANVAEIKLKELNLTVQNFCKDNKLDMIDVLFYQLRQELRNKNSSLSTNVDKLYEYYTSGNDEVNDFLPVKPNPLRSAALKAHSNLTVGQYLKIRQFEQNETSQDNETKLAPYKQMLQAEKECDVANVDYKLIDKTSHNTVQEHKATLEDPTIDISEDVGCLPPGLVNIPVDGSRISIVDALSSNLSQKYPEIVKSVAQNYPGLWLPDYTLRVHAKVAWDGTLGKSWTCKGRDREESDHWLAGCLGILQVDIEWGDGTRSILWIEPSPNSILSCTPIGLYKGEESNRPTLSYIMNAVDNETELLKKSLIELESQIELPKHVFQNHDKTKEAMDTSISIDTNPTPVLRMETSQDHDNLSELKFDDIVKKDFLNKFSDVLPTVSKSEEKQQVILKQRFNVRISYPKDKKFDRNVRGKAGAGSARPCVHCSMTLKECLCRETFESLPIEYNNNLERESIDFCLDNPLKWSRNKLDNVAMGMKRLRLTTSEVSEDITDALHLHINVSGSFMFKIGSKIFCFGGDDNPVFHWEKTASVKEKMDHAEAMYAQKLSSVITALPSLNQMPGDFGRAYIAIENREAVLGPLPDCPEKEIFSEILDLWEKMCSIHCKSEPTPNDRLKYGGLSATAQEKVSSLKWIKRWPNQFIRACLHNSTFLNDPEGTGSIGPHSTEPLESGNHWIKMYDDGHTFKGNREVALKGVFKLRRLKSSSKLQKFYPKENKHVQKCSVCHTLGHNKRNSLCPGPPAVQVAVRVEEDLEAREELELDLDASLVDDPDPDQVESDDLDNEESRTVQNYFLIHFVDETLIDDE